MFSSSLRHKHDLNADRYVFNLHLSFRALELILIVLIHTLALLNSSFLK